MQYIIYVHPVNVQLIPAYHTIYAVDFHRSHRKASNMSPLYGYIATAPIHQKAAGKLVAIHAGHELDFQYTPHMATGVTRIS